MNQSVLHELEDLQRKRDAIVKARGRENLNKYYCSICLKNTELSEQKRSICCNGKVITRVKAELLVVGRIEMVGELVRRQKPREDEERPKNTRKSRPKDSKGGKGSITVIFQDSEFVFDTAKRARKWLRTSGLTVKDAKKELGKWYFDQKFEE
jgi:hypothetical protein